MIVTAFYAALLTILFIYLSARVIMIRRHQRISLGDGGNETLQRRTRAQANCGEYAPLGIVLIGIAETIVTPLWVLHMMGLLLLTGRILHGYGVGGPRMNYRFRTWGMILTLMALAIGAIVNLFNVALGPI